MEISFLFMEFLRIKLQGEMKTFYNNGQLESNVTYEEGLRSGDYKYWDKNGVKEEEGIFLTN